jgi:hypothetical protein
VKEALKDVDKLAWSTSDRFAPTKTNRYVMMKNGSAIDMQHFMRAAYVATWIDAANTAAAGWGWEIMQRLDFRDEGRRASSFSSEDLASNALGAVFGQNYYDSDKPLAEQVQQFLDKSGALTPEEYKKQFPEAYANMPLNDQESMQRWRESK